MATTSRVTVTLPTDVLNEVKRRTDNVSGFVTELVEEAIRRQLLAEEFASYKAEYGDFTPAEEAATQALLDAVRPPRGTKPKAPDADVTPAAA